MAAIPADSTEEKRQRALLRSLRRCRRVAADIEFNAKEIRRAHIRSRFAERARAKILDLSSAGAIERNQRRAIPSTRRAGLRIPRRSFARDDRPSRAANARSR